MILLLCMLINAVWMYVESIEGAHFSPVRGGGCGWDSAADSLVRKHTDHLKWCASDPTMRELHSVVTVTSWTEGASSYLF